MKKIISIAVAALLVVTMTVTAFAATANLGSTELTAEAGNIPFALPEGLVLETGDVVTVHIKGTAANETVRLYFTDANDSGRVCDVVMIDVVDGAFDVTVDVNIVADGSIQGTAAPTTLLVKGPDWQTPLSEVTIEVLEITSDKIAGEAAPVEEETEAPAEEETGAPALEEGQYTAFLMFTTSGWYPSAMEALEHNSIVIDGDGTYTIETNQLAGATDALVFCIDIVDVLADHPNVTAVLDSIEVDGELVEFNADEIAYGDIEADNDNYRIEIRNEYGTTMDKAIKGYLLSIMDTIKVTFTVSGLDSEEAPADEEVEAPADAETEAPADEEPADTGLALAVVPAVVALAAVALSKKR